MLIFLVGLTRVSDDDTGVASGLVNVGQQVGGSIGLAIVGTVAWSAVASSLRSHVSAAARTGVQARIYRHALATGFSRGYLVSAGILVPAMIIAVVVVRARRHEQSGAGLTSLPVERPRSAA